MNDTSKHSDDSWRTVGMMATPPGTVAQLRTDTGLNFVPAPMFLHQTQTVYGRQEERIVIGLLNMHRGEIEAFDVEQDWTIEVWGELEDLHYGGAE